MPNCKVLLLLLVSLLACTPKSKPSTPPPPATTTDPGHTGTIPGNPAASPAQLRWEVVDAAKFGNCAGAVTAQLKLKNSGASAASWTLKQHAKSGLGFFPAQGVLQAQEEVTIAVHGTLTAADLDLASGKTNIEVIALYEKSEARLKIQEDVQGVLLQVDASQVDFGVVAPKDHAEQQLTLTNLGKTDTQLRFAANSEFVVNPGQVNLSSGGSQTINISFSPSENRSYSSDLAWVSSKPICAAFRPLVKLQGQGSTVFKTTQKVLEWNQSCSRSAVLETQDIAFSLRKNAESLVSLESIEGPFTVDAKEWTVAANTQGLVKVTFNNQSLQPGIHRGRLSLKDKASGEIVSFDLQATVIGSYVEPGIRVDGVFKPFDPRRGIEFFSSQVISSYASSPFSLDFVNRGNRPVVVKLSLQAPVSAPFISFPETSLTIQPGLTLANSFPLWLQTHQIGKWSTRMSFRYESASDAPLCNEPPADLPLHYTVSEDLDVEARALAASYNCGTNEQSEFGVDISNHSSRTVYVSASGLSNRSRTNSQLNFFGVEGVTFLRQSRDGVGTSFNDAYPLKKGESLRVIIRVTDRKRFESTFKTGERLAFSYSLRPVDSANSLERNIDINVDVAGAFLAVSPLDLNFGTVLANAKVMQTFQIKNDGTSKAALTLNSLVNGFSIVSPTSSQLEINPSETALVTVAYTGSSFSSGSRSWKLDVGHATNSCYSTERVVNLSATNSAEGLSFESASSTFGLSRGEAMGKSCDEIPLKSFTNRLRNMSSTDLNYRASIRLNDSLLKEFTASDLLTLQVNGQNVQDDRVFTIPALTMNGQGPEISLVWLKDIRTLSFEKYRLLAETQVLGQVVVSYADAAGTEITLPITWRLARIVPSVTNVDLGKLTTRGSLSFPLELKVLQNDWTSVEITTEFKDGSPGLTATPANPILRTSATEVLRNSIQFQLDPAWQAPSLSGLLNISAKESVSRCPLLSEFSLPVSAQVRIKDLVVDSESSGLTVSPIGKDFQVTSFTACGSRSEEQTIRIKNNGNYPISISDFQWEELAEASPFALTSTPSDLNKTLEPGASLSVKYRPLEAQRQDYYKEDVSSGVKGFKRKLKASLSADGEVSEVNFIVYDRPHGFYLPKTLFTSPSSFRQMEVKGNVALKVPDFTVPVLGGLALRDAPSKWTITSDFGEVQSLQETGPNGKLATFMKFPAGFTGTAKMIWTLAHETLKNCSPNSFSIEGTKSSDSIDVSLDPGNTVIATATSDTAESFAYEYDDGPLTAQLNFDRGRIFCGPNSQEQFINVTNNTSQVMRLLASSGEGSPWLPLQMGIPPIEPGNTGRIRVSVDSSRVDALGSGAAASRYAISLVANGTMPARTVSNLRIIQTAEIDGKIIKAFVDGAELVPGRNVVNFGEVTRQTTATRDIEWRIIGTTGSNQLEFRKSLVAPISDGTPESKLLDAFGSTIEREVFTVDKRKAILSFLPTVSGDHSVNLQVVGGPAMKNICSAPTIVVRGQGK